MPWGRNALVTGAAGGIGLAAVKALLVDGYFVHAHVRSRADKLLFERIEGNERLQTHSCDLSDAEAVKRWVEELQGVPIDVLVNNAALAVKQPFEELQISTWEKLFTVNVTAAFILSQWAFRTMKMRGEGGVIVQIASMASIPAVEKYPGFTAYTASKYACAGLAENLAREGIPYGIRSICLSPGNVNTKMLRHMHPYAEEWMEPEEVAMFLLHIVNNASNIINGVNIPINKRTNIL
ncbi:SDR family oxidoreductase [Paenibacillus tarimensis]|uniref:SDR family oxidoreductase n=1 Tax=Paenibacillus tarimensis TaxID=416012 RepID=UPI001F1CE5D5|nr:SDR family oxidoreductase [Paenibacillus tarimensis]MCF2945158.1 SDR family oxidoreductase [Paenibacillus tarimensis]